MYSFDTLDIACMNCIKLMKKVIFLHDVIVAIEEVAMLEWHGW